MTITHDNQGDAISRDVPQEALALIDAGGNGSERFYTYGDIVRLTGRSYTNVNKHLTRARAALRETA